MFLPIIIQQNSTNIEIDYKKLILIRSGSMKICSF